MTPGHSWEEAVNKDDNKTSQNDLNDYIRVSSPGLQVIIGALALVVVATVVWGFTGKIPVTITVTGCVVDSQLAAEALGQEQGKDGSATDEASQKAWVVCYVDSSKYSAEQIKRFDDDVTISMPDRTTFKGKIEYVSPYPLSKDEARQYVENSEWVAEQCVNSDYSWGIAVSVKDDISNHLFTTPQVTFITDEVPPIRFLTR